MDWSIIWKSIVLVLAGVAILRMTGRKSISQMTIAQTVVMVAMGTIIVTPIIGKSILNTILAGVVFAGSTLVLEFLQLKSNKVEKLITGKSIIVVENGKLNNENLNHIRMTVDQLEMRLRNEGITKIEDIKMATIEANGLLGYELKDDAKPVTVAELKKILNLYFSAPQAANDQPKTKHETDGQNIFSELHAPNETKHPEYLQ